MDLASLGPVLKGPVGVSQVRQGLKDGDHSRASEQESGGKTVLLTLVEC